MRIGKRVVALVAALALMGAACGDDDGDAVRETGSGSASASGSGSASGTAAEECEIVGGKTGAATGEIHVELTEFAITVDDADVAAGLVKFEVKNAGKEPHEIAIVRADDAGSLPKTDDGAVDDEAVEDDLVGEIEPFASGHECEATFALTPGKYVLLCNIVGEHSGEHEAHFKEGMFTMLTVT